MHVPQRRTPLEEAGAMKEDGCQSKVTHAYYWVVQNKACPTYACRADIKALRLQKHG